MKKDVIVKAIFERKPLIVVAYLGMKPEVLRSEAPKKGKPAETYMAKHSILWGSNTYELTAFFNSQTDLDKAKPMAAEFTPMVCDVQSWDVTKWGNRVKGILHTIEG